MKYCEYGNWSVFTILFFLLIYKWAQKAGLLHYTRLERFTRDNSLAFLAPFLSYEENGVNITPDGYAECLYTELLFKLIMQSVILLLVLGFLVFYHWDSQRYDTQHKRHSA
jgi:hypothetical protein